VNRGGTEQTPPRLFRETRTQATGLINGGDAAESESMRTLTDHIVSGDQAVQLSIAVTDEPGAGGANHEYRIAGMDLKRHPSNWNTSEEDIPHWLTILFQNGPINESGVNGITQEALLAIVIDRLRSFQAGPFSCRENAIALTHCEEALMWLQRRTVARIKRGVEGTNQK
jgi:hypothetical protein